ncbi:hypothetical protein CHS0354_015054 [Potamilus streckersoni]|uniref:Hexosyltransferase n=1 Tax=Potamilus streckersoni TaxID=2493646 RepID=A0AAE0THS0_9BIVA|nr:hypothetical protein CHS0354_015054 [Potamilus streckersoni]
MRMELSKGGSIVLLILCACGAINLLFYAAVSDPQIRGRRFIQWTGKDFIENTFFITEDKFKYSASRATFSNSTKKSTYVSMFQHDFFLNSLRRLKDVKSTEWEERTKHFRFNYILNEPFMCKTNSSLHLMIVVCSGVENLEARFAIRNTWGSYILDNNITSKLVFLLGKGDNSFMQPQIQKESQLYGDIIQGDFQDSYRNLSLKSVFMLHWIKNYCSNSIFVLKTDDDVFVNIPNLLETLSSRSKGDRYILGFVFDNAQPDQNPNSKWYTPSKDFPEKVYPRYCSGAAYVLTSNITNDLLDASMETKLFWLEDIFITGLCARKARVRHVHNKEFWFGRRESTGCEYRKGISGHKVTVKYMYKIFAELTNSNITCADSQD